MALTPSQKAAVLYDRNLILFAGPGSGKTATSIAKGRRILSDPAARLCMVTFTTAAAGEMQHRMAAAFAGDQQEVPKARLTTGTFHSLALKHYQRHVKGFPRLLPPPARSAMLHTMLAKYTQDERAAFTLALEQYQGALDPSRLSVLPEHREFIEDYLRKMRSAQATDLASVMRDCTMKMAASEIPLLPVTHLIGDEMQDADEVQLEFILNHSRQGVVTTVVADDDQTIYEWRCALGYAGLQHFAAEAGAKTITLGENFRSRQEVVSHARELIANNDPDRVEKNQLAVRGTGGILGVIKSSDAKSECEAVAKAIGDYKYDDEEIAVLARSNRALDRMEEALSAEGIAYKRDGPTLWDAPEIGLMLSLMRALISARTGDLLPVLMLLQVDAKVRKDLESHLGPNCGALLDGAVPDLLSATALDRKALQKFADGTCAWRKLLRSGDYNLAIPDIGFAVGELLRENVEAGGSASRTRRANILLESAVNVLTRLQGSLSKRLTTLAMMQSREASAFAVRLMTMHGSKGLEFDTVYLINASKPDDGSTLMEDHPERRLFYVALTRAKDRFFATYSDQPVKYIYEAKLPFIRGFADALGAEVNES